MTSVEVIDPNESNWIHKRNSRFGRRDRKDRSHKRVRIIKNLLRAANACQLDTYLDLGCGDASISDSVVDEIKISSGYCADIIKPEKENKNLKFIQIDEDKNVLMMPDKSIDLITCLVSIHHFKNLRKMIQEMNRISHLNTYLIIREHNANPEDQIYLDFVHLIYLIQKNVPIQDFYSSYYNRKDLRETLEQSGWKYIASEDYPAQTNYQKIYSSIYKYVGGGKSEAKLPEKQTTKYTLQNNNLLEGIQKLTDKKLYWSYLRHRKIPDEIILYLMESISLEEFGTELGKYLSSEPNSAED